MKNLILLFILMASAVTSAIAQYEYPYKNPELPVENRVADLLSRMT